MIEVKRDYERKTLIILELPQRFDGVTVVRHTWREGHIVSTVVTPAGHREVQVDWQKLSDLK